MGDPRPDRPVHLMGADELIIDLRTAHLAVRAAEVNRAAAARQYRLAQDETRKAYAARRAALSAAVMVDDPGSMRAAAAAMGISVPRVYQLVRNYPKPKSTRRAKGTRS